MIIEICNKCGCEFHCASDTTASFNYGSCYDLQTWDLCLCDDCLKEIVKTFKNVPKGFQQDAYAPKMTKKQHQDTFEHWKETGKWEEMMYIPYEELIEYRYYYEDEYINKCIKKYHPDKPLLK